VRTAAVSLVLRLELGPVAPVPVPRAVRVHVQVAIDGSRVHSIRLPAAPAVQPPCFGVVGRVCYTRGCSAFRQPHHTSVSMLVAVIAMAGYRAWSLRTPSGSDAARLPESDFREPLLRSVQLVSTLMAPAPL
jgi:hypothetical protein